MPSKIELYGDITLFGVRVEFKSDHPEALDAVLSHYSTWNRSELLDNISPIYIVINTSDAAQGAALDRANVYGTRLTILRGGIFMVADGLKGHGRCRFPIEADSEAILEAVNTIVLFLVAHAGRIPLHASAVMLGDTAVAFAGPSGSGKSTLVLAASRAGLPVLSDDTVFVQTVPMFRVWSLMRAIHVLEQDAPDVEAEMRFRSGRWKKVLSVAAPRFMAESAILCILKRGDKVALEPIGQAEAVARVLTGLEPGYEFYGERTAAAAQAVAHRGAWQLTLSADPSEAVDLISRALASRAGQRLQP